jgi:hypothetical protein
MFPIDLHRTLMHVCCRELLFSHMNTVSLHTLHFKLQIPIQHLHAKSVYTPVHTPLPMVTCISTWHMFSNPYPTFPMLPYLCPNIKLPSLKEWLMYSVMLHITHTHTHTFMEMTMNIRVKIILLHHNGLVRKNGMTKKNFIVLIYTKIIRADTWCWERMTVLFTGDGKNQNTSCISKLYWTQQLSWWYRQLTLNKHKKTNQN